MNLEKIAEITEELRNKAIKDGMAAAEDFTTRHPFMSAGAGWFLRDRLLSYALRKGMKATSGNTGAQAAVAGLGLGAHMGNLLFGVRQADKNFRKHMKWRNSLPPGEYESY